MELKFTKNNGRLPKTLKLDREHLNAVFLPYGDIERFHKLLPTDLKKQLELLHDSEKIQSEMKGPKHKDAFVMNFSEGGRLFVFATKPKEKTFDLHTRLRKTFNAELSKLKSSQEWMIQCFVNSAETENLVETFTSLVHLAPFQPHVFGKKKAERKTKEKQTLKFEAPLDSKRLQSASLRGLALAEANNLVRELALLPGNHLTPGIYRDKVKAWAKEWGVSFEYHDTKALAKMGAGAFLAVVAADPQTESGIAVLKYKPKVSKKKGHVAFVGKGLCFDTGGYNVKTGNYMHGMHEDMTGSAIALAMIKVFAQLKIPMEAKAYLALAENHISPTGYRPNDVVTSMNGLSIEVENTDAEGRMVLTDTLALASKEKPVVLMDYATLTGACFRALGTSRSGVFSRDIELSHEAVKAGERSGERVWNFPIGEDYEEAIKSDFADLRQCASVVNADHIYAATFLAHFVEKDVPWVHVDLSSHAQKGGLGLVATETNGFGVRFSFEFLKKYLPKV